ncbi:hypothetical protein BDY21DRAFT_374796 [Lineolata rhizophorae]|uniref:CENP-V/GFA domain-containing protein n=1 Tax=Lineolata rhizophorae TaxID=578093 RepID=A0A6A6NPM6_9PEZI|nr:hypothetical protein BDY21DRAFT_374796 [Lineolata rhizophorae]
MGDRRVHGSCACGRNRYIVDFPDNAGSVSSLAEVLIDNSSLNRRTQASPFSAWLRVPLDWYQSSTHAFFPDETHSVIRRTFYTPLSRPPPPPPPSSSSAAPNGPVDVRRQFCGFCGTPLSAWNEATREAADFISLTLGSVLDEDLDVLQRRGLLPGMDDEDEEDERAAEALASPVDAESGTMVLGGGGDAAMPVRVVQRTRYGTPWFEELTENSKLGKLTSRRGGRASLDGSRRVQWEVVEWTEGDEEGDNEGAGGAAGEKRKRGRESGQGDVEMRI